MDSGRAANSESRTRRRKTNRAASRRDFCLSFDLEVVSERWWILLVTNPLFWIIHTAAKFRLSLQVNPVGRHPRAISLFSARISIIILGVLGPSSMLPEESSTRMQRPAAAFPGVAIFDPHRCRITWNSVRLLVCTEVIFQDIRHLTAASGCLKKIGVASIRSSHYSRSRRSDMVSPALNGVMDSSIAHPGTACAILAWNGRSIIAHPVFSVSS